MVESDEGTPESHVVDTTDEVAEAAEVVEHDIETLLAERNSFRDIAQRLQADFENYRKRVTAQTSDEVERATGRLAEALLPVLDACEAAFVTHPAEIEPLFNLLLGELKKVGLEGMNIAGTTFDPNLAEAVMREDGDGDGEGNAVVVDVMRSGYVWKGKVLRPALVKVRG
ncbi:MAG: nucleotide exchange factor GrpE [Actinobacteria bacterium]|nr:nucleotide exchange factor GrpE [Actinomycetota bacterium]